MKMNVHLNALHKRRAITNTRVITITLLVVVTISFSLIGVAWFFHAINQSNPLSTTNNGQTQVNTGSGNSNGLGYYTGNVNVAYVSVIANKQTASQALTSATILGYNSGGGSVYNLASIPAGGTTIGVAGSAGSLSLTSADQGKFYMLVEPGTADFVDVPLLQASQQSPVQVTEIRWTPQQGGLGSTPIQDSSGTDQLMITVSVAGLTQVAGQTPSVTVTLPTIADDSGSLSLAAPTNLASQGTTTATLTSEWTLSGFSNSQGASVTQIFATSNQTANLAVNPTSLSIGGFQSFSSGQFSVSTCGTGSSGYADCWNFYNPTGSSTQQGVGLLFLAGVSSTTHELFDMNWQRALTASEHVSLVLHLQCLSPSGAPVSLSATLGIMGNA